MSLRLYRVALAMSLVVNALLITGVWLYFHFEATLAIIEEAVGFLN